jgi:hypothetical protein
MQKLLSYFSMLMLALLLFPLGEKAMHDFEHFNDDHCAIAETHFCETEHSCSLCDYVFSSASTPPQTHSRLLVFSPKNSDKIFSLVSVTLSNLNFGLSLRGPPVS